ncbi:GTP-binding protein Rhes [Esox lucius]|uniref:Small monomeric GTPase n=1 Tax=Esox lucius TaxID=8010 RepID=A0A3P8ZXS2_ESOLU|nr:GTP-binding protein Rhes [Esox lucius]
MPVSGRNTKVNATEQVVYLPVDGTAKSFSPCAAAGAPSTRFTVGDDKQQSIPSNQPPNVTTAGQSPKIHMQNKSISKASKGIFKTVTAHWRHAEKKTRVVRSSSTGTTADKGKTRVASSERFPKRRSFDPLAALTLPDQTPCTAPLEEMHLAKPSNCRRIVVLGAPMVGKTNLLRRFLRDGFEEQYEPTSEDFHRKLYQIRGETYQIDILDAARERNFPARRKLSILTGDIFLLVFSVDDRESFKEVIARRKEIVTAKTKLMKLKENARVPIVICGNKIDLDAERVVCRSEMRQVLGEDADFFETSAKDGTSLEEMFEALVRIGGLPTETRPSQHRKLSIRTYQALGTGSSRCGRRNHSQVPEGPCGAVYPLARRPSFNSDLQRVMGPSPTKRSRSIEKCQIQ